VQHHVAVDDDAAASAAASTTAYKHVDSARSSVVQHQTDCDADATIKKVSFRTIVFCTVNRCVDNGELVTAAAINDRD
jgi:hypothetical protein